MSIRLFSPPPNVKKKWNRINLWDKKQLLINAYRYSTESKQRFEERQACGLPPRNDHLSLYHDSIFYVGYVAFSVLC